MSTVIEIQSIAEEKIEECLKIAQEKWPQYHIPSKILVKWDLKGRVAGYAKYSPRSSIPFTVRLNFDLMIQNAEDFIEDTIPHEVAHIVIYCIYNERNLKVKPHGPEWQHVAKTLGCSGKRTHSYVVEKARQTQKFVYRCACKTWEVGLNRHRKIQGGKMFFTCRACKCRLALA